MEDSECRISDREFASKILRGSLLKDEQKAQVLLNTGGKYIAKRIENVLIMSHGNIHKRERHDGLVRPKERKEKRFVSKKPMKTRKPFSGKPHRIHEVTAESDEDDDGEDQGDGQETHSADDQADRVVQAAGERQGASARASGVPTGD